MSKVEANIYIDNVDDYSDIDGNLSFEELIDKHYKESVFHSSAVDTRNIDSTPTTICQHCDDQMSIQLITETNPLSTHQGQNYLEQEYHSASEWSNELFFCGSINETNYIPTDINKYVSKSLFKDTYRKRRSRV